MYAACEAPWSHGGNTNKVNFFAGLCLKVSENPKSDSKHWIY